MDLRRVSALLLSAALLLALPACGGGSPAPSAPAASADASSPPTPAPSAPAESEAPALPAESEAPSLLPAESPAPGGEDSTSLSCADIWNAVSAGHELPALMDLDDDLLSGIYGIDPEDLADYAGKMPLINVQATEIFIAQVASGKMDTVKASLEKRQDDLEEQWSSYLPDQLELVKNYRLEDNGEYVIFVVSEYADDMVESFNDCTK